MNYYKQSLLFTLLGSFLFITTPAFAQALEEFNGPFPSWANVKARFGAKGNGKEDDTKALQAAIDGLGTPDNNGSMYTVLYLPAGVYCISSTLVLKGKIGVTIVGEQPSSTVIKWIGPDKNRMFLGNGSAFYKISRLTWNANNHKEIEAIGIHWLSRWNDGKSQSYASLNIEISDNIFTGNCKYGISGGTNPEDGTAANDSEIAIKRCLFLHCTAAGLFTTGYNALDYWLWDCRFEDCNIGINSKFGNFFAYRTYFKNSVMADITNTNGYVKSIRGCFSENSKGFTVDSGASPNPFKRNYQGNTVLRPASQGIQFYHWGRLFFMDNFFDKANDTAIKAFVKTNTYTISVNNSFRNKSIANFLSPVVFQQYGDKAAVTSNSTGAVFIQLQDKTPPNNKRQIFEVPPGADENIIQQIINAAAKLKGKKPVIHFAAGRYNINKTLQIPAGADCQLLGDGCLNATTIMAGKSLAAGSAFIRVAGPTAISVRELQIGNFSNNPSGYDAIRFENADQPEARAFIDQLYTTGNNAIRAEGLDNMYIQKDNSFFADNDFISGGPLMQSGKGTAALYGFGGQYAGISLQNNAKAVLKDCWWEGNMRNPVNLNGSGNLTIDGAMIAPAKADSTTTIAVKKFKGNVAILNSYLQGGVDVSADNPGLKLLLMNNHFFYTMAPLKFISNSASFKGVFTGLTIQCFIRGDKRCEDIFRVNDVNTNVTDTDAFITTLLADDKNAIPKKYEAKNAGASNIFISRVSLGDVNNAIKISR